MAQHRQEQKQFKESELWYVLYALAMAKKDIKERSKKLGDIKPENIFINDKGNVKVANIHSWPNEHPSFYKAIDSEADSGTCLLAPEDIAELQRGAFDNEINNQSEVFAIGATVLSIGILGNFSDVYNYRNKTFDLNAFNQKRLQWAEHPKYSGIFKAVILNLVDRNPGERLTVEELCEFVGKRSAAILNKEQFVLEQAPSKVERSFAAYQQGNYY